MSAADDMTLQANSPLDGTEMISYVDQHAMKEDFVSRLVMLGEVIQPMGMRGGRIRG